MPTMPAAQFATVFALRPNLVAWFLGAGASAASGIPTGYAMIRDFKAQIFCRENNLSKREIDTAIYYPFGLHEQKAFSYLGYKKGDFPETERATRETLALPIYPEITREAQRYVVNAIVEFFG